MADTENENHGPDSAAGPLAVSKVNPRYFTVRLGDGAEDRVVYLTGSHIWNNFHDGLGPGPDCRRPRSATTTTPTCRSSKLTITTSSGSGAGSSSSLRPPAATSTCA